MPSWDSRSLHGGQYQRLFAHTQTVVCRLNQRFLSLVIDLIHCKLSHLITVHVFTRPSRERTPFIAPKLGWDSLQRHRLCREGDYLSD